MREQIQKLLDSNLSSLHIAKQTDVEQSTVYRLRKGERSLDKLGLGKAEKLYEFANELFNSEDDEKQHLLVKRASIMGMLANLEMTDEESDKLNQELHDIEGGLEDIQKRQIISDVDIKDGFLLVAAYKVGEKILFHQKELNQELKRKRMNKNDYFNKALTEVKNDLVYDSVAIEWLKDKDVSNIRLYLDTFYEKF